MKIDRHRFYAVPGRSRFHAKNVETTTENASEKRHKYSVSNGTVRAGMLAVEVRGSPRVVPEVSLRVSV